MGSGGGPCTDHPSPCPLPQGGRGPVWSPPPRWGGGRGRGAEGEAGGPASALGRGRGGVLADDEAGEPADRDVLAGPGVDLLDELADRLGVVLDERLVHQHVVLTGPAGELALDDLLPHVLGLVRDL